MTSDSLQQEIQEAIPELLNMARGMSWNKISNNCKFILTEIKDSNRSFNDQRMLLKKENDKKTPLLFQQVIPILQTLYKNLYDINLYIYKSSKDLTVIDIRYYQKSSLDKDYRQKVTDSPPMIHSKVAIPAWLLNKNEKFDINWERKLWLIRWKLFCLRHKL
ncbi:hypothetical protein GO495_13640 [Chitinophaga oryziterrae]|uniref:Uncharacterized protein n=2 Tax=Chitinophaga oryziterrae TaxID=1031224 RepID=A0A6N8JAY0_9BACT|nr:hypothetical protein [Chitinophaga oryziterrae]